MEVMIQTFGLCDLACHTCAYHHLDDDELKMKAHKCMDFPTFKQIADKFIEFGYDEFQMTPTVGEPLLDPSFVEKLVYLQAQPSVKRISFFTNFLSLDEPKLKTILSLDKVQISISVYGMTRQSYMEWTNRDAFDKFYSNIEMLGRLYTMDGASLEFFIRNPDWENTPKYDYLRRLITVLKYAKPPSEEYYKTNQIAKMYWNGNWCGIVPEDTMPNQLIKAKLGVCWYALIDNMVDNKGDIILCGACDAKGESKIGNVFENGLEDVYKEDGLYHNIIKLQSQGVYQGICQKCSEFHGVPDATIEDYSRKLPWLKSIFN